MEVEPLEKPKSETLPQQELHPMLEHVSLPSSECHSILTKLTMTLRGNAEILWSNLMEMASNH